MAFEYSNSFAFSKVLPATGKHLVRLQLSSTMCCIALGLIPASRKKIKHWDTNRNPHMIFVGAMAGKGGLKDGSAGRFGPDIGSNRMGMFIDIDAGEVVYFNQEDGRQPKFG